MIIRQQDNDEKSVLRVRGCAENPANIEFDQVGALPTVYYVATIERRFSGWAGTAAKMREGYGFRMMRFRDEGDSGITII